MGREQQSRHVCMARHGGRSGDPTLACLLLRNSKVLLRNSKVLLRNSRVESFVHYPCHGSHPWPKTMIMNACIVARPRWSMALMSGRGPWVLGWFSMYDELVLAPDRAEDHRSG